MSLEEINLLTVEDCSAELITRLELEEGVEPTLEQLEAALIVYKAELFELEEARLAGIKAELTIEYNLINHPDRIELTGEETIEQLKEMIAELFEKINHADAVIRFNALEFIHAEIPELNLEELTSESIYQWCDSLENSEANEIERLRVEGLTTRFNSLHGMTFHAHHNDIPNSAAWLRDLLLGDHEFAEASITGLESTDMIVVAERTKAEALEQLELDGLQAEELCKKIYRMIVGYNKNNLTPEQFPIAVTQYGLAQSHLRNYWPSEAKKEIEKVIENDVYPQEFKDLMLEVFVKAGY